MKGLELSRLFFEEYGRPALENEFRECLPYICVGSVGGGSERYGFDDEFSHDHDFEPGFCIFLPGEDVIDRKTAFRLERMYAKLPKEFMGFKRSYMSPVGGNRNGVIGIGDFYKKSVGNEKGELTTEGWLTIPDYALAEAVNGEVFFDNYGEFTKIRSSLMNMPSDVFKKRIAGNVLIMAQSGQYNFARTLRHGEKEAAMLSLHEFVTSAMKVYFLLSGRYMPYYKWSFRAFRSLPQGENIADKLSFLITKEDEFEKKLGIIDELALIFSDLLRSRGYSRSSGSELEAHAYSINDAISDNYIRNLNIFYCV